MLKKAKRGLGKFFNRWAALGLQPAAAAALGGGGSGPGPLARKFGAAGSMPNLPLPPFESRTIVFSEHLQVSKLLPRPFPRRNWMGGHCFV